LTWSGVWRSQFYPLPFPILCTSSLEFGFQGVATGTSLAYLGFCLLPHSVYSSTITSFQVIESILTHLLTHLISGGPVNSTRSVTLIHLHSAFCPSLPPFHFSQKSLPSCDCPPPDAPSLSSLSTSSFVFFITPYVCPIPTISSQLFLTNTYYSTCPTCPLHPSSQSSTALTLR